MKQSFTFNTFSNGLSNDPTKWKTHGYYSAGLDLIGIKEIGLTSIGGRPNVVQPSQKLKMDSISAGATSGAWHVNGLVSWIRRWDAINSGNLYAQEGLTSAGGSGLLLSCLAGTGTWVSAKSTSAAQGGGGLGILSANMYYGQDTVLGQVTSAGVYTNNFGSFTMGSTTPRPMKVFGGVLNIGNDKYISTVDSTGTFTAAALTLPSGFTVRALEVLGNYLVISADNGTFARIFLWTGGTATYQEAYDLPETSAPVLISREGRLFAIGVQIYQLGETSFTTLFPYSFFGTPGGGTGSGSAPAGRVVNWRNRILFGQSQAAGAASNADDVGGVWLLGNNDPNYPFINSLHFLPPVSAYRTNFLDIGGIYTDNSSIVKVGFVDYNATATSAKYGIATLDAVYTPVDSTYAYYVTLPINCDTEAKKIFHSLRPTIEGSDSATAAIDIYYRTDVDFTSIYSGTTTSDWTLLKTVSTDNAQNKLAIGIRKTAKNIQFKFVFNPVTTTTAQLMDYTLVYETLDSYR